MNVLDRNAWRALPLPFVVRPTLDAPTLAFDEAREFDASKLQDKIDELNEQRIAAKKVAAVDPSKHKVARTLSWRIRGLHLARVSRAIGVKLPGHPRVIHEFVDG